MTESLLLVPKNPKEAGNRGGGKRTYEQREHDLYVEAGLYLRHKSLAEIARVLAEQYAAEGIEMQLGLKAIHDDLKEIHTRWINSSLVDFNQSKAKELAAWDELERAYWEAWEKSTQDHTVQEMQSIFDEIAFAVDQVVPVKRTKTRHKIESRDGAAAFLQGVERCIDARCKILGLYSPEKFQVDWRVEAQKAGIDEKTAGDLFEDMIAGFQKAIEANVTKEDGG